MRARLLVFLLVLGCRKSQLEVKPDDQKSGPARVTCTLADPIVDAKVPARCDLAIEKLVKVPAGSSLEIGAGAKLTFAKGAGLVMEGGVLRARGTAEEPIVFTSATRVAGDFRGIVFSRRPFERSPLHATADAGADAAAPPWGASVLEHVVVEGGGGEQAALEVHPFPGDTVSLFEVRIKNPKGHALHVAGPSDVTRLEAIHTGDASVSLPLRHLASLGADQTGAVFLHGSLNESVKLAKRTQPWVIESSVGIDSTKPPLTFEIEKGTVLRFAKRARLSFNGRAGTVTLVAKDVTFTSAEAKPVAGDWAGIFLTGDIATDITGCTFEFAGSTAGSSGGVIRLPITDKAVHVTGSTFRDNGVAAFESWSSCKPWEDPALKNTSVGKPLCDESPLVKLSTLGALSALGSKPMFPSAFDSKLDSIGMLDVAAGSGLGVGGYGPGSGGPGTGSGGVGIGGIGGVAEPAKPASKVVESSITASGGLPVDVVRKTVRGRVSSLRACHGGSGSGTLTVAFTIADAGTVTSAKITGGTLTDASVRSCVTSVFQGMSFPSAEGAGSTTATATHDYS